MTMFEKCKSYVLFNAANRFYFTRFESSSGCVILTPEEKIFITDSRYIEAAKKALAGWTIIKATDKIETLIAAELNRLGLKSVGFEDDTLSVAAFKKLEQCLGGISLVPISSEIAQLRAIKTEEEISKIAAAQQLAEKAFLKAKSVIKPGITERDFAAELLYEMQKLGASGAAFDIIVAFGENTAFPHHKTGQRALAKDDIILVDMGAKLDGFCSDMTRTFNIGNPCQKLKNLHALVLEAQNLALSKIRAGMTCKQADAIVRDFFKATGYEKEFGHSLGHSIGIAVHENPRLAATCEEVLKPNMVVTVEPGLYIEGLGGVRIEDMIVIKENGNVNLTKMGKDMC